MNKLNKLLLTITPFTTLTIVAPIVLTSCNGDTSTKVGYDFVDLDKMYTSKFDEFNNGVETYILDAAPSDEWNNKDWNTIKETFKLENVVEDSDGYNYYYSGSVTNYENTDAIMSLLKVSKIIDGEIEHDFLDKRTDDLSFFNYGFEKGVEQTKENIKGVWIPYSSIVDTAFKNNVQVNIEWDRQYYSNGVDQPMNTSTIFININQDQKYTWSNGTNLPVMIMMNSEFTFGAN